MLDDIQHVVQLRIAENAASGGAPIFARASEECHHTHTNGAAECFPACWRRHFFAISGFVSPGVGQRTMHARTVLTCPSRQVQGVDSAEALLNIFRNSRQHVKTDVADLPGSSSGSSTLTLVSGCGSRVPTISLESSKWLLLMLPLLLQCFCQRSHT